MVSNDEAIIALDVGERRIGVAIAGLGSRLARAWGTIERSAESVQKIKELATDEKAKAIVVGLPRGMEGQETAQTAHTRAFANELKPLGVPIYMQDETLTSKQAEAELMARGVQYNKGDVDALAALYILNDFLEVHPEV